MSAGPDTLEPVTRSMYDYLIREAAIANLPIRGTQFARTDDEQLHLWQQGRALQNGVWVEVDPHAIVTHARPGSSAHNFKMAFDICFQGADPYLHAYEVAHPKAELGDPRWLQIGELGEKVGLEWGGRWSKPKRDRPHFQRPSWKALAGRFA